VIYGLLGICAEVIVSAILHKWEGKERNWSLRGQSYLWSFPLYGLIAPLFEPLHNYLRPWHWLLRGTIYVFCFWIVEYSAGWILRRALGSCPWNYGDCRYHLHGLIRWDFFPLWFVFGMFLEFLHDRLVILTPQIIAAFSQ
jgi:Putative ABC-transporter type IV